MTLYMAVTADKYELPMIVSDSVVELAKWLNRPLDSVYCAISRGTVSKNGYKVVRVRYE